MAESPERTARLQNGLRMTSVKTPVFPGQESPTHPPNLIQINPHASDTYRHGEGEAGEVERTERERDRTHWGWSQHPKKNQEMQRKGQTEGQMVNSRHGFHKALKYAHNHCNEDAMAWIGPFRPGLEACLAQVQPPG